MEDKNLITNKYQKKQKEGGEILYISEKMQINMKEALKEHEKINLDDELIQQEVRDE